MLTQETDSSTPIRSLISLVRDVRLGAVLVPLALAVLLAVGGCDTTGTESNADDEPDTELDRTLEPGGTAKTEAGARLMAASGALEESVSVTGREAPDPTAETPIPEVARAPGPFYRVSGDRNIDLPVTDAPLYLALPVPEDADPSQLALGVRIPSRYVTDTGPSSPEYDWDFLPGAYEPERGLLVVPARFLLAEGIVLTVMETSDYASPSMADATGETLFEKTTNFFARQTSGARSKSHGGGFKVKCKGGFSSGNCGSTEKSTVETYLKNVHDDFVSDFRSPDLKSPLFSDKYVWIIKKDGTAWCKGNTVGKYLYLTNKAITCYDGSGDPSERTTRHEFFHAIQSNYAPISWGKLPKQRPKWVIEATAELAADPTTAGSKAAVRDSGRALRPVDVALTDNSGRTPYRAQDFWTYLINRRSATMAGILDPMFKQQSNAPNKPTAEKVDALYSLPDEYWGWVRNQAVESQVTGGYDGELSPSCVFDPRVASPDTVTYDAGSRSDSKEKASVVSRLSARVMAVQVQTGAERIDLEITASTSAPKTYVRAYLPRSSSSTDCWTGSQDASHTITDMMESSSQKTYYVLVSATTIDVQRSSFNIKISHEDRLTK